MHLYMHQLQMIMLCRPYSYITFQQKFMFGAQKECLENTIRNVEHLKVKLYLIIYDKSVLTSVPKLKKLIDRV